MDVCIECVLATLTPTLFGFPLQIPFRARQPGFKRLAMPVLVCLSVHLGAWLSRFVPTWYHFKQVREIVIIVLAAIYYTTCIHKYMYLYV
ncbi:hypothetical protein F5Y07DRAFT_45615 [Xylaria sp. FL0933]|nr:hypothetical protein F5Y07DRAFT_45615 [Xylaria sp. FL0933]